MVSWIEESFTYNVKFWFFLTQTIRYICRRPRKIISNVYKSNVNIILIPGIFTSTSDRNNCNILQYSSIHVWQTPYTQEYLNFRFNLTVVRYIIYWNIKAFQKWHSSPPNAEIFQHIHPKSPTTNFWLWKMYALVVTHMGIFRTKTNGGPLYAVSLDVLHCSGMNTTIVPFS